MRRDRGGRELWEVEGTHSSLGKNPPTTNQCLYSNMDNKKVSLVTLCDLSGVFDSFSHDILFRICHKCNNDSFWCKSYLSDRTQSVGLNDVLSDQTSISYWVPQGSFLVPILFNIYVNDLAELKPDCDLIQYADDTQRILFSSIDNIKDLIRRTDKKCGAC